MTTYEQWEEFLLHAGQFQRPQPYADGLLWFQTNYGVEADYQAVLDLLAKEEKWSWAEWLLRAVGPIDAVMEFAADTNIGRHLYAAGHICCTGSLTVSGSVKAGEFVEAGYDFGIYCGLRVRPSERDDLAFVCAKTRPKNILLGKYRGPV